MTPRTQNLLSIGALVAALVIAAFPAKARDTGAAELSRLEGRTAIRIAEGKPL